MKIRRNNKINSKTKYLLEQSQKNSIVLAKKEIELRENLEELNKTQIESQLTQLARNKFEHIVYQTRPFLKL